MLILIGLTACIWFGVGIKVGMERGKSAYHREIASYPALYRSEPNAIKRGALLRSIAVFCGWSVAGLIGAIVWAALWTTLLLAKLTAKEDRRSAAKGNGGGIIAELVLLGLFSIGQRTISAIERNVDDYVIYFAVVFSVIAGVITYHAIV